MKLLGWMQHKLRQSSREPFKDFTIGSYCNCLSAHSPLNDEDYLPKPASGYGYGSRYSTQSQQESENSFTDFEAKGVEVDSFGDDTSTVISGLFHGFLTIGTLGSDQPFISEPETPTFTMSLGNINEEKTEVTENDLKLINDELEKFLEAEAEEHGSNYESSGRNSQVSTITLSGYKQLMQENNNTQEQYYGKTIVCPLQGYLFGSSVELPEARLEGKKEKASLAELFNRTKIAEENPIEKCGQEEMQQQQQQQTKQTNKPAVKHLINKILKKIHASSGSCNSTSSTKKKFQKVIKLFHRKIHPESSIVERESKGLPANKMNKAPYVGGDYTDGEQMHLDKVNKWFPQGSVSKDGIQNYKNISKLPQYELTGFSASAKEEHWIRTDADYLVLEL